MPEIRLLQEVSIGQGLVICCGDAERPPATRIINGVGVVDLIGRMVRRGGDWQWGTEELAAEVDRLTGDSEVAGIAVYTDSGGGEAGCYYPIAAALDRAVRAGKPVEGWLLTACSAAYGAVAVRGVRLVADNSAAVGGLGSAVKVEDTETLGRTVGVATYVSASPSKAPWSDQRVSVELFRQADALRMGLDQQFRAHVALGRGFDDVLVADAFAAGVVHAARALELGLVDEVRPITLPLPATTGAANHERSA